MELHCSVVGVDGNCAGEVKETAQLLPTPTTIAIKKALVGVGFFLFKHLALVVCDEFIHETSIPGCAENPWNAIG